MARIRQKVSYSDTRAELVQAKSIRQGASEDAFWDEDEMVDYRPRSKRKNSRKYKGCPENNGKAHVYVYVDRIVRYDTWFRGPVLLHYRDKVCCGCEHRSDSRFMGRAELSYRDS